jgi:hypothetical protein
MARVLALAHHPAIRVRQTREWRTTRLLARLVRLSSVRRSRRSRTLFIARSVSSSSSRSSARAVRTGRPHVGCLVGPDGLRRIQKDRVDDRDAQRPSDTPAVAGVTSTGGPSCRAVQCQRPAPGQAAPVSCAGRRPRVRTVPRPPADGRPPGPGPSRTARPLGGSGRPGTWRPPRTGPRWCPSRCW